jgi:hypothetical protein
VNSRATSRFAYRTVCLLVVATCVAVACGQAVPAGRRDQRSESGQALKIDDVAFSAVDFGFIVHYRTLTPSGDCTAQAEELPKVWDLVVKARLKDSPVQRVILFPEDTLRQSITFEFRKDAAGQWVAKAPCSITTPAG